MRRLALLAVVVFGGGLARADDFGTGGNQFSIDFATISGSTNPASGFGNVAGDYRMGVYEITNGQWDKFKAELGVAVTGNPLNAYEMDYQWTGTNVPTNRLSWYEAAQFVNWLNTSTGHLPAYKFTGEQGTPGYTLGTWDAANAAGGTNLYRHKEAFYFLPTEDEWIKAAYWNGTSIQTYATKAGESFTQGDGTSKSGWNYEDNGYATNPEGPWNVGSGSEELNRTFDMMGNVWEWMESPWDDPAYVASSSRGLRGGSFNNTSHPLLSSSRYYYLDPRDEIDGGGFRVASVPAVNPIPEPSTLIIWSLLGIIGIAWHWKRRIRKR